MSINSRHTGAAGPGLNRLERFLLQWKAKLWLLVGLRGRASEVFRAILVRSPDDLLALNSLGFDAMQSGHLVLARSYYERVTALTPDNSNAHFNLAFVCDGLGQLDDAERSFRAAIRHEEKMDRAWYGLGLTLIRLGRLDEALVALKHNTKLQSMSPYAWYQMARVHVDLKQPEEARAVIAHLKGFEPKVAAQLERETGLV